MKFLLLALLAITSVFATSVKAGFYTSEAALRTLRSIPLPASYNVICPAITGSIELYVFMDEIKTGGEFPETAVPDFAGDLAAACTAALAESNTWDFHARLVNVSATLRDGHSGWVAPSSFYAPFDFVLPFALSFSVPGDGVLPAGAELPVTLARNPIFWDCVDKSTECAAAYEAHATAKGLSTLATLRAALGQPVTSIDGKTLTEYVTSTAPTYGQRTDGQRAATVLTLFGHYLLQKYSPPSRLLEDVARGPIQITAGEATVTVAVTAVAKADLPSIEDLEFPKENMKVSAIETTHETRHRRFEQAVALPPTPATATATGTATAGEFSGTIISLGEFIRAFRTTRAGSAKRVFTILISTFAPQAAEEGAAELKWLHELESAVTAVKLEFNPKQDVLLVDNRNNPGGYVELANAAISAISDNSYPYAGFKVFNRAAVPRADPADPTLDPFQIYAPCLPLLENWTGKVMTEKYLDGSNAYDRYPGATHKYTTDAYYPNLGRYNAFIRPITGRGRVGRLHAGVPELPDVAKDNLCTGEFAANAYPELMRIASTHYHLGANIDNMIVAVGPVTASGGADSTQAWKQANNARVVASMGHPGVAGPEYGQLQAGKVPGGDTVTLTDLVLPNAPAAAAKWLPGGVWPSKANFKFSNFAISAYMPRSPALARGRLGMIREFSKEPVAHVLWHSTPYDRLADLADAAHRWGTLEDATAFAAKVHEYTTNYQCQDGTYSSLGSQTDRHTGVVSRRPCVDGKWTEELQPAECLPGFLFNEQWLSDSTLPFCVSTDCGAGSKFSAAAGFCIVDLGLSGWEIGAIVGGAALGVSIIVLVSWAVLGRFRRNSNSSEEKPLLSDDENE